MADDLDAALAWADSVSADFPEAHVVTLAAAVRELREQRDDLNEECKAHILGIVRQAEAALAALKRRTCDGCRESVESSSGARFCIGPGHGVACEEFGFTCGAWAVKEGSNG